MSCCHEVSREQFDALLAAIERGDRRAADEMPDETAALKVMFGAWERLKKLGFRDAMYCPRDPNKTWQFAETGSTGLHEGYRDEQGRFWLFDGGDVWPSRPILFREMPSDRPAPEPPGASEKEPKP